jgi:uncharacterized protein with NRDE domain
MCLIFLALNYHPEYKMIVAGNRDEFYNRRTAPAAFWEDHPDVLGGRDLEGMGTWLGITRSGRLSMLTNFRDPGNINPAAPSRGKLVSDFLVGQPNPEAYINSVFLDGASYNGFNLLAGTVDSLWYYSNYGGKPMKLESGLFGLSNHLLDTPWPKVVRGKQKVKDHLTNDPPDPDILFKILYDEDVAPDTLLPQTGLSLERERALSSMFIKTDGYGSRCTTVLMIDRNNNVYFAERAFDTTTFAFETRTYGFKISPD